jgi:hypothetical protein
VFIARGAWLAVGAGERVFPNALSVAEADIGGILAVGANVAPLAIGDAVAVEDAVAVARGLRRKSRLQGAYLLWMHKCITRVDTADHIH